MLLCLHTIFHVNYVFHKEEIHVILKGMLWQNLWHFLMWLIHVFFMFDVEKNCCKKVSVTELSLHSVPNADSDLLSSSIDWDGRHDREQSEWADGHQGHLQGFHWIVGHPVQQSQDQGQRTNFIVRSLQVKKKSFATLYTFMYIPAFFHLSISTHNFSLLSILDQQIYTN